MFNFLQRFGIIFFKFLLTTYLVKSLSHADFSKLTVVTSIVTYFMYLFGLEFSTLIQQRLIKKPNMLKFFVFINGAHNLVGLALTFICSVLLYIFYSNDLLLLFTPLLYITEVTLNDSIRYFSFYGRMSFLLTALLFRSFAIPLAYLFSYLSGDTIFYFLIYYIIFVFILIIYIQKKYYGRIIFYAIPAKFFYSLIWKIKYLKKYWSASINIWVGVLALKTFDPLDKIIFHSLFGDEKFVEYSYLQSFALMIPLFTNFMLVHSNMHKLKNMPVNNLLSCKFLIKYVFTTLLITFGVVASYITILTYYLDNIIINYTYLRSSILAQYLWGLSQIFWLYLFFLQKNLMISVIFIFDSLIYLLCIYIFNNSNPNSFYLINFYVSILNILLLGTIALKFRINTSVHQN